MSTQTAIIEIEGGFHNTKPITIKMPLRVWAHYGKKGISKGQEKRLSKHFCGIKSCSCGGADRAKWELKNYSLAPR